VLLPEAGNRSYAATNDCSNAAHRRFIDLHRAFVVVHCCFIDQHRALVALHGRFIDAHSSRLSSLAAQSQFSAGTFSL
jgi:hypothetical protein